MTGIDFSARFIRVCHQLQERGSIRYAIPDEGELVSYHERTLAGWAWTGRPGASSSGRATPTT